MKGETPNPCRLESGIVAFRPSFVSTSLSPSLPPSLPPSIHTHTHMYIRIYLFIDLSHHRSHQWFICIFSFRETGVDSYKTDIMTSISTVMTISRILDGESSEASQLISSSPEPCFLDLSRDALECSRILWDSSGF